MESGHHRGFDEIPQLVENLQDKPLSQFHPRSSQKSANRLGRATLCSDNLPDIRLSHSQLKDRGLLSCYLIDDNLIRIIH